MLSLDMPTIVSLLFILGAAVPAALILTLGYLPVGALAAAIGNDNIGRIVFTSAEIPWLVAGAAVVVLLAGPTFLWRISHFRRILRFNVQAPGQISRLSATPFEFRVDYVYRLQQRTYFGHNAIRRNSRRERRTSLRPGQTITALVEASQPEASIVLELYAGRSHDRRPRR